MKNNKRVTELAAERAKDLLSTTFAQEGVLGLDSCQRITFVSPGAAKLLGYCREELEQKKILAIAHANGGGFGGEGVGLLHTSSPEKVCQVFQCQFKKNDGDIVWVEYVSVPVIEDGALAGFTVVFGILPTKGDSKQHFGHIANVDVLTGLPNRYSFLDYVCKALARAKRSQSLLAICFMDLDNFKQVNDSLGHNIGDELLKMIPSILKPSLRDVDYLARLSGDEFGLILENVGSPAEVREVLGRYLNLFNQAIKVKRYEINISVSIGVALYPTGGEDSEELVKNADIAMYKAKDAGKNTYAFFNEETNLQVKRQHQIEVSLRKAIKNSEFYLCYQPQFEASTQTFIGVEALLRWNNPNLPGVTPDEFIPIAEDCGLINNIGIWVAEQVARDFQQLASIKKNIKISINVSIRQLEESSFVLRLQQAIELYHFPPQQLTLEVTETAVMHNPEQTIRVMNRLSASGFCFALDDFGTGYSSMMYLKRLPFDYIKIDQSFVGDIEVGPADDAIVQAIIQLSNALDACTIAEGVETEAQKEFLRQHGCTYLQGYLFDKPMLLSELVAKYKGC